MNIIKTTLLSYLLLAALSGFGASEPVKVPIIAYMGHTSGAPGNTVGAFHKAAVCGMDGVSCDVWFSADQVVVCANDPDIFNATCQKQQAVIAATPYSRLRQIDVSWGYPYFDGETVPALVDMLRAAPAGKPVYIFTRISHPGLIQAIAAAIKKSGLDVRRVRLASADANTLQESKRAMPTLQTLFCKENYNTPAAPALIAEVRQVKADGVILLYTIYSGYDKNTAANRTKEFVAQLKQAGVQVAVLVEDADAARKFIAAGVDALFSNSPIYLRETLDENREELQVFTFPHHPLNLLLPGMTDQPEMVFLNSSKVPMTLSGTIVIKDTTRELSSTPVKFDVKPGARFRLTLPGKFDRQDVWYIHYRLLSAATVREFSGVRQLGRMIPAGPVSGAPQGFRLGICSDNNTASRLAASMIGVQVRRGNPPWCGIQPNSPDEWHFEGVDDMVNEYQKLGIELQYVIGDPPKWAIAKNWKPLDPRMTDAKPLPDHQAFERFVARLAERYRGRIHTYIVFNEPDTVFFANYSNAEYFELLRIAYRTIKAIDPDAVVMNGGIASIGSDTQGPKQGIVRSLFTTERSNYDEFTYHGHAVFDEFKQDVEKLLKLRKLSSNPPPIYFDESALSAMNYGENKQAEQLFEKVLYAWSIGAAGYNWYNLFNDGNDPNNIECNFGLFTYNCEPKPAALAYNMIASHYRNGTFLKNLPLGKHLEGLLFRGRNNAYLLADWGNDKQCGESVVLISNVTGTPTLLDLFGNAEALKKDGNELFLKVSAKPTTLRVTGQATEPTSGGEVFMMPEPLEIAAGEKAVFRFGVTNPLDRPLAFSFRFAMPAGLIASELVKKVIVNAKQTIAVTLPVAATDQFSSYAGAPAQLGLTLQIGQAAPLTLKVPVMSVTAVALGAYPAVPAFRLDSPNQVRPLTPNIPNYAHLFWKGPEDLSAKVYLARNTDVLRLKAVVTDDKHFQPYSGEYLSRGDSLEFALRLPGQGGVDFGRARFRWEFMIALTADGKSAVVMRQTPAGFDAVKVKQAMAVSVTRNEAAHTTTYEVKIPLTAIGLTDAIGRQGFRFNLGVNDNDGEMPESIIMAAPPGIGGNEDTPSYPLVKFR